MPCRMVFASSVRGICIVGAEFRAGNRDVRQRDIDNRSWITVQL